MSSAATRCCTPSPSVARDLVHIQKIAVRTVLPSRHERRQGGPSGVVLRPPHGAKRDNLWGAFSGVNGRRFTPKHAGHLPETMHVTSSLAAVQPSAAHHMA